MKQVPARHSLPRVISLSICFGLHAGGALAASVELQGNYLWTGVSDAGTLGMGDHNPPGIRHDPAGTGTFPGAPDDYLTPGTPWEMFGITTTLSGVSTNYANNNSGYLSPMIVGSVTDYSGLAYSGATYDQRAVWSGQVTDLFSVTLDYHFNLDDEIIWIDTVLTALADLDNVEFLRAIDPDAGGSYSYNQRGLVDFGISESDFVTASGPTGLTMAMYSNTAYTHNTGISSGWSPLPDTYLSGTDDGDGDYTVGIGFDLGSLLSGESITFNYAYVFGDVSSAEGVARLVEQVTGGAPIPTTTITDGAPVDLEGGELRLDEFRRELENNLALGTQGGTINTPADVLTVSGGIGGSGSLSKIGGGTLSLRGDNTFSGGLIISEGTVDADAAARVGTGAIELRGGAFSASESFALSNSIEIRPENGGVQVAAGRSLVLAGDIGGSGALTKSGTGTMTLSGTNTFSGGLNIEAGGVLASAADQLGSGGVLLNGGSLGVTESFALNRAVAIGARNGGIAVAEDRSLDLAGDINGGGRLVKSGAGVLRLSGDNGFNGLELAEGVVEVGRDTALGRAGAAMSLSGGDLRVTASTASARAVRLGNGSAVIVDQGASWDVDGAFSGDSCLVKRGAGRLNLRSDSANAVGACVEQGVLAINASFGGNVLVESSGSLRGAGAVTGTLLVQGRLAPGNSPGTLSVDGDVMLAPDSVSQFDIDGYGTDSGAGSYSRLLVSGSVSLDGSIEPILRGISGDAGNTFVPRLGDSFRVIEAGGGVSGSYDAVTQPGDGLADGLQFEAIYFGNAVDLRVTAASYATYLAPQARRNALAAATVIDAVRAQTVAERNEGQNELIQIATAQNADTIGGLMESLAGDIHALSPLMAHEQNYAMASRLRGKSRQIAPVREGATEGASIWTDALYEERDWDGGSRSSDADVDLDGYLVGVDLPVGSGGVGLAAGTVSSRVSADHGQRSDIDGVSIYLYGWQRFGDWQLAGYVGHHDQELDTERRVSASGDRLSGSAELRGYGAGLSLEREFAFDGFSIAPMLSYQTVRLRGDDFLEAGNVAYALAVNDESTRTARTELALALRSPGYTSGSGLINYEIAPKYGMRDGAVIHAEVGLQGQAMHLSSPALKRDYFGLSTALRLTPAPRLRIHLQGDLEQQGGDEAVHRISATLSYLF